MQWETIIDGIQPRRPPNLITAFTTMSLSTLAYVDLQNFGAQLQTIFPGTTVTRVGGGINFAPHLLLVKHNAGSVVAVEGTRNWIQWASYVHGSKWERWPTGRGAVFGPFLRLFQTIQSEWINIAAANPKLAVAGHSLGAVMACFFARFQQDLGLTAKVVHTYGTPRSVDALWVANYRAPTWCLDHPLDQVAYAPMDAVGNLTDPLEALRIWDDYVASGTPWILPAWEGIASGSQTWDQLRAFAAAASAPRLSFHETFQYLRGMVAAMNQDQRLYCAPLILLMNNLGLFNPWPA